MPNTKNSPYVTIGIASYNYEPFLQRAMDAIRRQTFQDFEVLYSDDCSTDRSVEVIQNFIMQYPEMRIRLLCNTVNVGVMENKNRIIREATGKYLMFCDADDWMEDNCLSELVSTAQKTDADQIIGEVQNIDDKKILQIQRIPKKQSKWTWGLHHATLYKMEIIKANDLHFIKNCYPDDVWFNMIFHEHCDKVVFVHKTVYNWYKHTQSASNILKSREDDRWTGYSLLKTELKFIKECRERILKNQTKNSNDSDQIEYMAIKVYCFNMYHRYSNIPFCNFYNEYLKMNQLMSFSFPSYRKNKYANSFTARGIVRIQAAIIVFFSILFEKIHLIRLPLFLYWWLANTFHIGKYIN